MNNIKQFVSNRPSITIFFLDLFLIALAVVAAFLLRFDIQIPEARVGALIGFTVLALIITPIIFVVFNLYKISWSYLSLMDLPQIGKAVGVSVLLVGIIVLFSSRSVALFAEFPRSVIILYGILLFLFIGGLRFAKRIYWQMIKGNSDSVKIGGKGILNAPLPKNIIVTGGAGYLGSVLVRQLLEGGYKVTVVDKLLFGSKSVDELMNNPNFTFVKEDILNHEAIEKVLVNADAVVHLAAIVGEAACASRKDVALNTNYLGTVYLARLCKRYGISRFIYFSTCSIYGKSGWDEIMNERSIMRPVDFYGETKIYAERELMRLADDTFSPTILRLSTVYGLSPRMRFDLVVNVLTKKAVQDKEITIFGGDQWRPLIHVSDVGRAIISMLKEPLSKVGGQVFNVGGDEENYTVLQLGELVKKLIPDVNVKTIDTIADNRSYKVDFGKIRRVVGFQVTKTVADGIEEIQAAFKKGMFPNADDKIYYNHLAQGK